MKRMMIGVLAGWMASTAGAQTPSSTPASQILVSGTGVARTMPDMVSIGFTIRGEGVTSDEASARLRDKAEAIRTGIAGLLRGAADVRSSRLTISPIRSKECDDNGYGRERLSTGPCAILGYVAAMPASIETDRVADAGTLAGLIGRLGGFDVGIRNFGLRDDSAARQQAMRAALANAQAQARLIAESSGGRLGALLQVQDPDYRNVTEALQTEGRTVTLAAPAAPLAPEPVRIMMKPEPIQTTARLMVAYAIER